MAFLAVWMLVLVIGSSQAALATTGSSHVLVGHGLRMAIDTRWLDGSGYRPVRIEFKPLLVPTTADRTLRVEFIVQPRWGGSGNHDTRVVQDIEIPAGTSAARPVRVTLSVPQYGGFPAYRCNVVEDGKALENLCQPLTSFGWNASREALPAVLFVADKLPDTGKLAVILEAQQYTQNQYSPTILSSGPLQLPTAMNLLPGELPERWIDCTSLDVVCLSLEQLKGLKKTRPTQLQAILDWTAAGGNLWVHGIGDDWRRTAELDDALGLPPAAEGPNARSWQEPSKDLIGHGVTGVNMKQNVASRSDVESEAAAAGSATEASSPADPKRSDKAPFRLRALGIGMVAAIAADDPFRQTKDGWGAVQWQWLLNALGSDRWRWRERHGLSMVSENPDFWTFLIPGVGLVPVTEFCILITLFMLAIGPLNYWFLRRRKRLHLLVVTVPLCAAALTSMLFAYALIADGLATRVRVRSITEIDQRRSEAVCWSRLSFYSGLAPARGLVFPADVAVLPLEQQPSGLGAHRDLVWEADQRLASGWLNSRTPTQFITIRAAATDRGLRLVKPENESDNPKLSNHLGTRIAQLVVRMDEKTYYRGEGIDVGATAALTPVEPEAARSALRQALADHQPAVPPGMNQPNTGGVFGVSRRNNYYRYGMWANTAAGPTSQHSGRLEQSLCSLAAWDDATLLAGADYVAIVERSPEVVLGTPDAKEESSFHVIVGKW